MIDNCNLIIIVKTLSNNKISYSRLNNLINNFSKYNINIFLMPTIDDVNNPDRRRVMYNSLMDRLKIVTKLNYEYILIIDDDFFPIDNFLEELNETIKYLPETWDTLHLAIGSVWGRKKRGGFKGLGVYNPNTDLSSLEPDKCDRFFINCKKGFLTERKGIKIHNGAMGSPMAWLFRSEKINHILEEYKKYEYNGKNKIFNNDIILTKMIDDNTFICKKPLGYECECGGTTY